MEVYLVGGAVRDQLLGKEVHERDYVVVGATPEEMLARGYRQVGKDFPVFLHPDTSEEYALARTERKSGRGYTGFAIAADPSVTLEQDLRRRDLTVNAIARAADGGLIDPYGGLADLKARKLRHVSEAFVEDPLRVLRAARFAARFAADGFTIAEETLGLMQDISASGELETLANERVWQETVKALSTTSPAVYFEVLAAAGALEPWFAELHDDAIFSAVISRLAQCPTSHSALTAFASWHGELSAPQVEMSCERLRVPNEWRQLARLAQQCHAQQRQLDDAEQLFQCLQQADSWRRPERVPVLVQVWQSQGLSDAVAVAIEAAFAKAQQVNASAVISAAKERGEQLQGPAIGAAVTAARAKALRECLEEHDQQ
ncbi:hypothetical protein [Pseudidiomarina insulisalsae]|uniref:tRNA nucleotidyltransferase n=1 Tax=Pseudidiomarina insulisalsae TaxID=575789 RepID=A0A432YHQ7_9GAMM|nr:hypothetical protein [Pseudidiomarina insulisalsae]RUO60501.1 hypothetical protein CWI71_06430 [Pseudidiomarina insulisalsae]